jgi:Homeodomain
MMLNAIQLKHLGKMVNKRDGFSVTDRHRMRRQRDGPKRNLSSIIGLFTAVYSVTYPVQNAQHPINDHYFLPLMLFHKCIKLLAQMHLSNTLQFCSLFGFGRKSQFKRHYLLLAVDFCRAIAQVRLIFAVSPDLDDESGDRAADSPSTSRHGHHHDERRKRPRTAFTGTQIKTLETEFEKNKYLSVVKRVELSKSLGLSQQQLKVWYQ